MNNKQLYKDTFDNFKMSEEALGKVKDMSENKKIKHGRVRIQAAVATAAAVALAFVLGNVAVYAATGSAPVMKVADKVMEKVAIYIDGKRVDNSEVDAYVDKEGNTHIEMEVDDGTQASIVTNEDILEKENLSMVENDLITEREDGKTVTAEVVFMPHTLKQKGDKVFLVIGDDLKNIDITKDFSDGSAEGEFELEGDSYKYSVSGTVEEYHIDIEKK